MISTNFTAPHASILYQALADEAIVKSGAGSDHSIKVTIDPLPYTAFEDGISQSSDSFNAW